jgi:hypothetical protein
VGLDAEHFASFVPGDPPRAGVLAVWGGGQGPDELDLVLPAGTGTRRRRVRGRLLPLADVLPALLAPAGGGVSASIAGWTRSARPGSPRPPTSPKGGPRWTALPARVRCAPGATA